MTKKKLTTGTPQFLARSGATVLLAAIVLYVLWGSVMVLAPGPLKTTPMVYLLRYAHGQRQAGIGLLITAAFAAWGIGHPGWKGLLASSVQNGLLWVSATSAMIAVWSGHYPDGTVPTDPHAFIFVDQLLSILFAFLHATCLALYHGRRWSVART